MMKDVRVSNPEGLLESLQEKVRDSAQEVDWMDIFQGIAALGPQSCPKDLLVTAMDRFYEEHRHQLKFGKVTPTKLLQIVLLESPPTEVHPAERLFVEIFLKLQSVCGVEIVSKRFGFDGPVVGACKNSMSRTS